MRRLNRIVDNGSGSGASSCACTDNFSSSGTCSKELRAGVGVPDDKGSSRSIDLSKFTSVVDDIMGSCGSQVIEERHCGWNAHIYLSRMEMDFKLDTAEKPPVSAECFCPPQYRVDRPSVSHIIVHIRSRRDGGAE